MTDAEIAEKQAQLVAERTKWVHVDDPWNDSKLLEQPEVTERELEDMALFAARALRRTIYENKWV